MGDVPVLPALQGWGNALAVVEISSPFRGGGRGLYKHLRGHWGPLKGFRVSQKTPLFHGTCISLWGAPIRKIPKASRLFFYNGYSDGNELKTIYFTIGLKIFLVVTEFGK